MSLLFSCSCVMDSNTLPQMESMEADMVKLSEVCVP